MHQQKKGPAMQGLFAETRRRDYFATTLTISRHLFE